MRKLGLIGRWAALPAAGITFTLDKPRMVQIEVNTGGKVGFAVEVLPSTGNGGECPPPAFLGVVDGLETFEFRVPGPFRFYALEYDPAEDFPVSYATQEGLNFAIDGEHLRDFTVPMIGRRERNEEMDKLRFEMRQEMRQQAELFKEFMQFQNARHAAYEKQEEKKNGKGDEAESGTEDKPADPKPKAGGFGADKNNRRRSEVDPKRPVSKNGDVQQPTDEGDTDGSPSSDT